MAERMTPGRWTALLTLVLAGMAQAGEMRDPTRPPSASASSSAGTGGRAAAAQTQAATGTLTAIRIDAGQRVATIGGVRVKAGSTVGDGVVRIIRRDEVVLSTPAGPRVLKLFPGVHQQASAVRAGSVTRVAQGHRPRGVSEIADAPAPSMRSTAPTAPPQGELPQ